MAELYRPSSTAEVVPEFKSTIFAGYENNRFAVGRIGEGGESSFPIESLAYHRLRANVYEREGFISQDNISQYDGGEYDDDDNRSIHMAVLENGGETQRLIASMRLIMKGGSGPLPIEELYPDVFANSPAPETSCEVSRYIIRHEDKLVQRTASWGLFQQGLTEAVTHNLSPVLAVVSPALFKNFRSRRLPVEKLAEPVWIEKYGEENMPIAIDIVALAEQLETHAPVALEEMIANQGKFTYSGERPPGVEVVILGKTALGTAEESSRD